MSNPFEFVNEINTGHNDIIRDSDNPDLMAKEYLPFITNRTLSYFPDIVLLANEMNRYYDLPHEQQFAFFLFSVRKRKRFSKWAKKIDDQKLDLVMQFFGYNEKRALEIIDLLSDSQIKIIQKKLEKGGINHGRNKHSGQSN
tara:strand:+ start:25386 stop:25811 length:426 start_codon:yes stop_codon:yes gene_type:complete